MTEENAAKSEIIGMVISDLQNLGKTSLGLGPLEKDYFIRNRL